QIDHSGRFAFIFGVSDSDIPAARFVRRTPDSVDARSPARHQRGIDTVGPQVRNHLIHRVSFADSTRIEAHAGFFKSHGAMRRVEFDVSVTHVIKRGPDFSSVRQVAATLVEAPNLHQWPNGDVKRTVALAAIK